LLSLSWVVLGGELAVPCSLQSAPAGPNPLFKGSGSGGSSSRD